MDFLKAIGAIITIIGLALMLGRLDHHKNPEGFAYGWLGAIAILLFIRMCL